MPAVLTLHQGDAQAEFVEHPIEVARRALLEAAEIETGRWPDLLRESARLLPHRGRIKREED